MEKEKYIIIFGGGAVRGIAYIGAVQAFEELNINADKFVGSSVGAIFATLYCLGYKSDELRDIFHDFNAFIFKDINFGIGPDFAFSKGEIYENWIRELIEKKFYGQQYAKGENAPVSFADLEKKLYICTTDLAANEKFIFSKENTPNFEVAKAVRISSSFPGLMKPVILDNKFLVDGDLAKSFPLWYGIDNLITDEERILEFRLEGCKDCMNPKTVANYFNTVYSSISNFSSELIINKYKDNDKFDYILINTKDLMLLDFQISNEIKDQIAENGYRTTKKYFSEILPKKKKLLLPLYKKAFDMLNTLLKYVKNQKCNLIKDSITNFVCEVISNEDYKNLDKNFIKDLFLLERSIINDINEHAFLPFAKIKNKHLHINKIIDLINLCERKINKMSEYIAKFDKNFY